MIGGCFITDCQKKGTRSQCQGPHKVSCFGSSMDFALGCTSHPQPRQMTLSKIFRKIIFRNIPEAKYPSRTVQCRPLQSQYLKGKPGRNKNDIVKNTLDNHLAISYIEFLYYIIYSYIEFLPHALPAQVCWSCCCQAHCQCCFVLRKKVIEIFSQI